MEEINKRLKAQGEREAKAKQELAEKCAEHENDMNSYYELMQELQCTTDATISYKNK